MRPVALWLAWAVANGFSTLSEVRGLWWWAAPVAMAAFWRLPWRRALWIGAAGSACAGLAVVGLAVLRPSDVTVESRDECWWFTAMKGGAMPREAWLVLPDERVLGLVPGREARRLALARPDLEIAMPQARAPFLDGMRLEEARSPVRMTPVEGAERWSQVWVLGAGELPAGVPVSKIWRLHPLGRPDEDEPQVSGVILPQLAGTGDSLAWRRWAEEHGVAVRRSGIAGMDVRALWPEIIENEVVVRPSSSVFK